MTQYRYPRFSRDWSAALDNARRERARAQAQLARAGFRGIARGCSFVARAARKTAADAATMLLRRMPQ